MKFVSNDDDEDRKCRVICGPGVSGEFILIFIYFLCSLCDIVSDGTRFAYR